MIRKAHQFDLLSLSQLHMQELPNTTNSRIGEWFIRDLYALLLLNKQIVNVWIYEENNKLLGLITTTSNRKLVAQKIFYNLTLAKWFRIILFSLKHPIQSFIGFFFTYFLNTLSHADELYILTLAVDQSHHRKKIGSLLIQHVEEEARNHMTSHVQVDTSLKNSSACQFYYKNNYMVVKTILGNIIFRKKISTPLS
ncbi:MAG: hypothetical protein A3E26_04550 [Chlamydiae bacterium RIFCSPHIGHO2_12_FULL_49_32]|nr:MAG: hypothetical protein A3E26_04550 [Chlamydiae bacterium RIFCSPHIGHO2_12_FULL_49_32]